MRKISLSSGWARMAMEPIFEKFTLLPCPFCGSGNVVLSGSIIYRVKCRSCEASSGSTSREHYTLNAWIAEEHSKGQLEAVELWNAREFVEEIE